MTVQPTPSPTALPDAASRPAIFASDAPAAAPGDPVAALFAEILAHARAETPLALAVVGGAGSGKTSFVESTLARVAALTQAARGAAGAVFLGDVAVARADLSRLPPDAGRADVAALLAAAVERALRRSGGELARAAEEAGVAGADAKAAARAADEAADAARKRLEAELRDLEQAKARRARLSDALLYETPGSKVDSYARGRRSRIDAALRAFGYGEGDTSVSYRNLVGEVAELGSGVRAAPTLTRAIWGFPKQRRLLVAAAVFFGLWMAVGWAQETKMAWEPWLRAQNAGTLANLLLGGGLGWASRLAFLGVVVCLGRNLWRAWSFADPLTQGARLLHADVAERGAELDRSVEALTRRVDALRAEADAARRGAEAAARRAAHRADAGEDADDLSSSDAAERFLEAAPRVMRRRLPGGRLLIALDGADRLAPAQALAALETAGRIAAEPGVVLLAAFDPDRLAAAVSAPRERRDRLERLFQASWRIEAASHGELERLVAATLAGARAPALIAPDPARSLLEEPFDAREAETLRGVAPLLGASPRLIKRLGNLYRVARLAASNRPALALALAAELGGVADQVGAAVEAVSAGREAPRVDSAIFAAISAARDSVPGGALTLSDLSAARRLARRFAAFDAA